MLYYLITENCVVGYAISRFFCNISLELIGWAANFHITPSNNRVALTVLCSGVKYAPNGDSTKEVWGETRDVVVGALIDTWNQNVY